MKIISNPISFQNATSPTKRKNTRMRAQSLTATNNHAPKQWNHQKQAEIKERNPHNLTVAKEDGMKRKEQPKIKNVQLTSPEKSAEKTNRPRPKHHVGRGGNQLLKQQRF